MKDTFSQMHPIVNFIYFVFVIAFSMFLMNPVCLAISLLCALINAVYLNGYKAVKLSLKYLLPMIILIMIINPVFNHEGVTIITYFSWGNPLTLESIVYGIAAAVLLSSVVLWFSCFNAVITSDKFIYLFGRIIPSLSLILSMSLRFIPKFTAHFREVRNTQRCIGRDISDGSIFKRIKNGVKLLSIMISWAMENAIETADSMKSRGYGLKGRTAFSIYRFDKRDGIVLSLILAAGSLIGLSIFFEVVKFRYFPSIKGDLFNFSMALVYILYALLMLIPFILNIKEELKWKRLRSSI